MRYVYGNDYGDLAQRQLATDSAIDSRFMNSLREIQQMNQLHQAEASREAQLAMRAQEMAMADARAREINAANNAERQQEARNRFLIGMQQAAYMKPYYEALAARPDAASVAAAQRAAEAQARRTEDQAQSAQEEEQIYRQAQAMAEAQNYVNRLNRESGEMPSGEDFKKSRTAWYNPWGNNAREATLAQLGKQAGGRRVAQAFDEMGVPMEFSASYPDLLTRYRNALAAKLAALNAQIQSMQKGGVGDFVRMDETGKYIPNVALRFYRPPTAAPVPQAAPTLSSRGRLSLPMARGYLNAAGGDKNKAREMARADGWEF